MEEVGKKVIRALDRLVHHSLIASLAVLLVLGCYSLWDSHMVYERADATQWQPYKPTEPEPLSFWELQRINPDVTAWLTVYGTNIDYPVCRSDSDMDKYLTTNAKGEYSLSGALFIDPRSSASFDDRATIVYGHHMEQNVMFGQLTDFADKQFFEEHRYGNLFVNDDDFGLDFFCYLDADAYDTGIYRQSPETEPEQQDYLELLRGKAKYWRNQTDIGRGDRIVLLSTCSSGATNARSILVGRICDTTFDNPFLKIPNLGTGVDANWGWLGVPWWCWIILFVFLALIAVYLIARKKDKGHA